MHYKASNRHYLMEATNADYNVIKTAVDANYKTTLNKYLMAGVSLIDPVDGKPTKIQFNPLDTSQVMSTYSQIGGENYDREIGNPTYTCGGTVLNGFVDATGKPSVEYWNGHLAAQEFYSQSIGAQGDQPRAAARNELTNELGKVAAAACKAIDDLSKGLPNPLIKVTTTTKPEEKKALPATKGTGKVTSTRLISAGPPTVITAEDMKSVGLSANEIPKITERDITQSSYDAYFGGFFMFGNSRFECAPETGQPQYRLSGNGVDLYEPQKSAWIAYKTQLTALFKKQCISNANWVKTAQYEHLNDKGEVVRTGKFDFNVTGF